MLEPYSVEHEVILSWQPIGTFPVGTEEEPNQSAKWNFADSRE